MEVTVLEAENMPRKPVIAVRAGTSLRHVEMSLHEPFRVPRVDAEDNSINISLYQMLGTQTILDADQFESVCNIPVRLPAGTCSQVKLRVRRGATATSNGSSPGAEDYLNTHQLEARIQSLFEMVLKQQPENPYRCMIQELRKIRGEGDDKLEAEALPSKVFRAEGDLAVIPKAAAPVAPAEPPPKHGRPSPAAKGRNYRLSEAEIERQADVDTKAALAEVMTRDSTEQSPAQSSKAARQSGTEAHPDVKLTLQVRRLAYQAALRDVSLQSTCLGSSHLDQRQMAALRRESREIARASLSEVWQGVSTRLLARSLGVNTRLSSDNLISKRDQEEIARNRNLTQSVVKAVLYKASSAL